MSILIIGLIVSFVIAIVWGYFHGRDIFFIIIIILLLVQFLLLLAIKFNIDF